MRAARAEADYLSDGVTESIINSLSQLPKLRVVPRSTVFAYKGRRGEPAVGGARAERGLPRHWPRNAAGFDPEHPGGARGRGHRDAGLGRSVPASRVRVDRAAGADRLADLGGAAHPADGAGEEAASAAGDAQRRGVPGGTCAGGTSGASGGQDGFRKAIEHFERAIRIDPEVRARVRRAWRRRTAPSATTATSPQTWR